jgi:hypothetical protein
MQEKEGKGSKHNAIGLVEVIRLRSNERNGMVSSADGAGWALDKRL